MRKLINRIKYMETKNKILICSCGLLVVFVIIFVISSITKYNRNKLEEVSLLDIQSSLLYRQYINYSVDNTMHEDMDRDNAIKYMTVYSINKILKEKNIDLKEKYGNCFKDGVYVLDGDVLEDKIHKIFGSDIKVDYKKIFSDYDESINNIKIDNKNQLDTLKKYPSLNAYSIDGVYKSKKNEFWLYSCNNINNITVNTKLTKIERNKDTIIIYDEYYLKESNDDEVKYSDTNGVVTTSGKKSANYKHVFKKVDGNFRWESSSKIN